MRYARVFWTFDFENVAVRRLSGVLALDDETPLFDQMIAITYERLAQGRDRQEAPAKLRRCRRFG